MNDIKATPEWGLSPWNLDGKDHGDRAARWTIAIAETSYVARFFAEAANGSTTLEASVENTLTGRVSNRRTTDGPRLSRPAGMKWAEDTAARLAAEWAPAVVAEDVRWNAVITWSAAVAEANA